MRRRRPPTERECGTKSRSRTEFERELAAIQTAAEAAGSNPERLRVYCDAELLLLDIQESDLDTADIQQLEEAVRGCSRSMRLSTTRRSLPVVLLRAACLFVYLWCIGLPFLALVLPLRWLSPLLRLLGWRSNRLPSDAAQMFLARGMLAAVGVRVVVEGMEHVSPDDPAVVMFSHTSNLDAVVCVAHSPVSPKWVAKRELFYIPLLGWILSAYGHIPINRKNLEAAKRSLQRASDYCRKWCRCVAIAPEGSRSTTGLLIPFKKGPFHTAKSLGLPVQPVIFFGSYELWPPKQLCSTSGVITMRYLPRMVHAAEADVEKRSRDVRRAMLESLREPPQVYEDERSAQLLRKGTHFLSDVFAVMCLLAPALHCCGVTHGTVMWGIPWALAFGPPLPAWISVLLGVVALCFARSAVAAHGAMRGPEATPAVQCS